MLCEREQTMITALQVGKLELPVQSSSNLRFKQLPARLPALTLCWGLSSQESGWKWGYELS